MRRRCRDCRAASSLGQLRDPGCCSIIADVQISSPMPLKPFSTPVPLATLSPITAEVAPLLFRSPNSPRPRIPAEYAIPFADNFQQKQREAPLVLPGFICRGEYV